MGHANLTNLSTVFSRRLYAKGKVCIADVADFAQAKGEKVHASEGEYSDAYMIAYSLEEIAGFWLEPHRLSHRSKEEQPIVEVVDLTPEQEKVYKQWLDGDTVNWDSGDDGRGGEYGIFDSILWRYTTVWRKKYPEIPLLEHFTN